MSTWRNFPTVLLCAVFVFMLDYCLFISSVASAVGFVLDLGLFLFCFCEFRDVRCVKCGRRFHSVCVMYTPELWPFGYVCKQCALFHNAKFLGNKFSARSELEF